MSKVLKLKATPEQITKVIENWIEEIDRFTDGPIDSNFTSHVAYCLESVRLLNQLLPDHLKVKVMAADVAPTEGASA